VNYYAKLNGYYINIISLRTNPYRLRNTRNEREAICYTEDECKILKRVYPGIEFELFKLYTKKYYAPRNQSKNQ
jgi:hypothetical protein